MEEMSILFQFFGHSRGMVVVGVLDLLLAALQQQERSFFAGFLVGKPIIRFSGCGCGAMAVFDR